MSNAFREALLFCSVVYIYICQFSSRGVQAGFHGVELDKDLHHTLDFLKHAGFACGAQSYLNLHLCVEQ